MQFLSKLRCSLKTSYKDYYASLPLETLKRKRKSLKDQYFIPLLMWAVGIAILAIWVQDISQVILFSGVVIPTAAGLYEDYKKRRKCLDRLIKEKT
jgi:hypothetical protein